MRCSRPGRPSSWCRCVGSIASMRRDNARKVCRGRARQMLRFSIPLAMHFQLPVFHNDPYLCSLPRKDSVLAAPYSLGMDWLPLSRFHSLNQPYPPRCRWGGDDRARRPQGQPFAVRSLTLDDRPHEHAGHGSPIANAKHDAHTVSFEHVVLLVRAFKGMCHSRRSRYAGRNHG